MEPIPAYPEAFLRTAMDSPEVLLFPISRADTRHLHREAIHRHPALLPAIIHLQAPHRRTRMDMHGEDREEQMLLVATYPQNGYRQPQNGYAPNPGSGTELTHRAIRTSSLPAAMLLETGLLREHRAAIQMMASPRLQNNRQSSFLLLLDADAQKISLRTIHVENCTRKLLRTGSSFFVSARDPGERRSSALLGAAQQV